MRHLAYAAMLAFVLVGTLPLHRAFGLDLTRQVRRVALSVLPVAIVFVAWDVAATAAGHWAFDPAQVLPVRVFGLPLEELAFFVVVPLAGLLTFEAVGAVLHAGGVRRAVRQGMRGDRRAMPDRDRTGQDRS
ncbi:MAG: lycopene cyclase domain-containing protein [Actinomycetota bacterium]|nr:lycopene cyclase domain-containing protein [Actinomycetota bacterium]